MKDIFSQELKIGDVVAFNPPHYKGLTKGEVIRFTPKGVRVQYTSNSGKDETAVRAFDVVRWPV